MRIDPSKAVPRVVLAAAVGYCVWPSVTALTSAPETTPPTNVAEIAAALLSPKPLSPPGRNPFLSREEQDLANGEGTLSPTAGPGAGSKAGNVGRPGDPLSGVTLNATCIAGDTPLATINGRIYGVKECLLTSDGAPTKLTVVAVLPYKVLLEYDGKTLELAYSNPSPTTQPAGVQTASSPNNHPKTSLTRKSSVENVRSSNDAPSSP
jgi:hypothetical protein